MMLGRKNLKLTKPASTVRTSAQMSDSQFPLFSNKSLIPQSATPAVSKGMMWGFPKIVVPPNHPILIGFSIIFTIQFGVFPLFLDFHPCIKPSSPPTSHLLATFLTSQRLFCGWPTAAQKNMVLLSSFFLTQNTTRFLRI